MARRDSGEMGRVKKIFWLVLMSMLLVWTGATPVQAEKQQNLPATKEREEIKTVLKIKAPPSYLALGTQDGLIITGRSKAWRDFRR